MKRRITRQDEMTLRLLADDYRKTIPGSGQSMLRVKRSMARGVYNYARNWLLSTGELPQGVHEVPHGRCYITEVNFSDPRLQPSDPTLTLDRRAPTR